MDALKELSGQEIIAAANDVEQLNNMFSSVARLAKAVKLIGPMREYYENLQLKADAMKPVVEDLERRAQQAKEAISSADASVEKARVDGRELRKKAEQESEKLLSDAKAEAIEHTNQAHTDAKNILDSCEERRRAEEAEILKLQKQAISITDKIEDLEAQRFALQEQLEEAKAFVASVAKLRTV
jgi:chromosome segregation ATPase